MRHMSFGQQLPKTVQRELNDFDNLALEMDLKLTINSKQTAPTNQSYNQALAAVSRQQPKKPIIRTRKPKEQPLETQVCHEGDQFESNESYLIALKNAKMY